MVPDWLLDVLLGYGDPSAAAYWSLPAEQQVSEYNFFDTFLDLTHVADAFPHADVKLDRELAAGESPPPPPYRLTIPASVPRPTLGDAEMGEAAEANERPIVTVSPYPLQSWGPYASRSRLTYDLGAGDL